MISEEECPTQAHVAAYELNELLVEARRRVVAKAETLRARMVSDQAAISRHDIAMMSSIMTASQVMVDVVRVSLQAGSLLSTGAPEKKGGECEKP